MALKLKAVLSVHAPMVFKFFCCLVMEKIEVKVLACFYKKPLLTFKILTETLFKMVVAAFSTMRYFLMSSAE